MFTGLIQTIAHLTVLSAEQIKVIYPETAAVQFFADLAIGDSVAVDGICLTVTQHLAQGFLADISPETLRRSSLGQGAASRRPVNLETSLRVGGKIGGHFVTGHIDGLGSLVSAEPTATSWELTFQPLSAQVQRYLVPKGSIAVNGVSLTVAECAEDGHWFKVAVIPHTYSATNLIHLRPADLVNLEGDILGKYVERLICPRTMDGEQSRQAELSLDFLAEHGYL